MSHPLYFLHIPRTGGTTTRYWLWEFFAVHDFVGVHHYEQLARLDPSDVARRRFFSGHFGYKGLTFLPQDVRIVTVLRDPLEHAKSVQNYNYMRPADSTTNVWADPFSEEAAAALGLTLEQAKDNRDNNVQTRNLVDFYDPESVNAITAADLAQAKRNLAGMAAFGLTDRLRETALLFCFTLAWPPHPLLDHLNASDPAAAADKPAYHKHITEFSTKNRLDEELITSARLEFDARLAAMLAALGLPAATDLGGPAGRHRVEAALRLRFLHGAPPGGRVASGAWRMDDALFFEGLETRFYWGPGERWIRWARPAAEVAVYLPLATDRDDMTVHVELILVASEDIRAGLQLALNGRPLETRRRTLTDAGGVSVEMLSAAVPPASLVAAHGWQALSIDYPPAEGVKAFALAGVFLES